MVKLICNICKQEYEVHDRRKLISKTCSKVCRGRMAGKLGGKAGKGVSRNVGAKRPDLSAKNKIVVYKGKENGRWKGDDAGYIPIHMWVRKNYGKPTICEKCNSTSSVQWANKSHRYNREDRSDWIQLCPKCHSHYDNKETKHVVAKFKNHVLNPEYTNG